MSSLTRGHLSKEFFELVKAIGESKSKQEEDRIIVAEIATLKERFSEKGNSRNVLREFLVRLIYVELLGHDGSFGYVHAIQLTASENLTQKRVGYLCSALCLSPEHEFRFMLVNQMQRDLMNSNMLNVSIALIAVCKLVTEEMIPAVLPVISNLLKHEQSGVRKKACMALHRCYQLNKESVAHLKQSFRTMLCDKDPSVMGASLCWLYEMAKEEPQEHKDLVPSYVSILKQITEHRLPRDFDYHRIPAPWIQIKLLKILAVLGRNDQRTSEGMYEVLGECMRRADTGINVGYAVIYECVKTVTTIYPNSKLLDAAAAAISRFITSEVHNLKYLGVTGLAAIVRDHPRYATQHQLVVLDCLEDPDETLKRKTLDLLFRMTNPVNVEVIVDKLIVFLRSGADEFLKRDLVTRITQLAERYAPNNNWYVSTMTTVFELGGDLVESEVAHNLIRLLAEGNDDEEIDREMREEACLLFIDLLEKPILPEILMNVMCWTLGEYCFLIGEHEMPETIDRLCEIAQTDVITPQSRGYVISAIFKMTAQLGVLSPSTATLIDQYASSVSIEVQQRCYEFREAAGNPNLMSAILPVDASCEDFTDVDFSFLSDYVEQQRAEGLPDYSPPKDEEDDDEVEFNKRIETLRYDAYEKPTIPTATSIADPSFDTSVSVENGEAGIEETNQGPAGLNLRGVKSVWGASGYAGSSNVDSNIAESTMDSGVEDAVEQSKTVADLGFELPPGVTLKDLEDDMRARAQMDVTPSQEETRIETNRNMNVQETIRPKTPEPEKPKELSDREKAAAALFGGMSSDTSATKIPSSRTTKTRRLRTRNGVLTPAAEPSAPMVEEQEVDLLGLDSTEDAPSVPVTAPTSSVDLLDSLDTIAPSQGLVDLMSSTTISDDKLLENRINTETFGSMWSSHSEEQKLSVGTVSSSIDEFAAKVQSSLGISVVEVIASTQEAIFCGKNENGNSVLVHAKLNANAVDLMVRTQNKMFTDRVSQMCQTIT